MMVLSAGLLNAQEVCTYKFKPGDQNNFNKAVSSYKAKRYAECANMMRTISARNPKAADPYYYLGMTAVKQNTNVTAIRRYFTKLFEVCPNYPQALACYYRGVIYYSDDQFEEAVEMLERFFEIANSSREPENDAVYEEASNYLYWSRFLAEAEKNKSPFDPKVVMGVSSYEDEILPYFTWDGQWAYYLRKVPLDRRRTYYTKDYEEKAWKMYASRWRDTSYSTGEELKDPFNQHSSEGGITMTADNRLLYYSVAESGASGYNNCDIYYSEWRGGTWTSIKNAGRQVNGEKSWESQPSITPDGQYLYFASNRAGGVGGTDIWRCRRLPNGDWSRAENLGSRVNTAGNEKCPFIHADGHTLYFASDGWQGFGGYDMYFIDLANDAAARPANMGLPINTENDDICFGVNANGETAYFAGKSVAYTGVGGRDVFRFDLFPAARPEPMKVAETKVADSLGKGVECTLSVRRYGAEEALYIIDRGSGETSVMLSGKEDNIVMVEGDDFQPWIRVVSAQEVRRNRMLPEKIVLSPMRDKAVMMLSKGMFDGRQQLTTQGQRVLDCYVEYLQNHPMLHVEILAPTSAQAQSIYDYFLTRKLRKERLKNAQDKKPGQAQLIIFK